MSRRVLLISYTFPPVGGAGVQRVTKFAKYLPRCGWACSVLTAANPSVPAFDESLAADVPADVIVRRARTLEPSYGLKSAVSSSTGKSVESAFGRLKRIPKTALRRAAGFILQPDAQVLWAPGAIREGRRLLRETPHAAIIATGPPFSAFLIGAALSRRSGLPLVLDYRDEWDLSNQYWENKRLDPVSLKIQQAMQRRAVRAASAIVATTRRSAEGLAKICQSAGSSASVACIYNGYDPDDFVAHSAEPSSSPDEYRLSYLGTLWQLTSAAALAAAVKQLHATNAAAAARLRLVFAGRRVPLEQAIVDSLNQFVTVEEHGYVDHHEAVRLMAGSNELCVILANVAGAERVMPAKVFEYMATGRPILAIAPRGELWEVLEAYPQAAVFEPTDIAGIARHLSDRMTRGVDDRIAPAKSPGRSFDRFSQARELAEILDRLPIPS